jgi:hypothetical protein
MGPAFDNRTMTAQRFKRRPPMWVVAALSCSIALLIAGVVVVIVSSTSSAPAPETPGATGAHAAGPFSSARAALDAVVAEPVSSPSEEPSEPVAPPPVVTAEPEPEPEPERRPQLENVPEPQGTPKPAAPTLKAGPAPAPAAPRPAAPAAAPKKSGAMGALTVVCMPKCDQIVDNGTSLGPGHIFNRPVASGRHVLQLSAPNGVKKNLVIDVTPEQTKEVRISMDR